MLVCYVAHAERADRGESSQTASAPFRASGAAAHGRQAGERQGMLARDALTIVALAPVTASVAAAPADTIRVPFDVPATRSLGLSRLSGKCFHNTTFERAQRSRGSPQVELSRSCGKTLDHVAGPYNNLLGNMFLAECPADCYADCNGDGEVNTLDFLCFLNRFVAGDPRADCNGDSEISSLDFLCFLSACNHGCF
ncbi:MAG: hypothetical protein KIS87_01300 [Phycisphaeraceae bacterium]|nr:hypothetical protein [Phycisphaeraceae bacterium]